jgi:trehalose 6-phosphate phosphatase
MTATGPTQRMLGELNPRTIGLFLDVDGTLLDIAPRPEAVEVKPGLVDDIAGAERALGGALALVSGRPIAELDRLFAPLRVAASGIHGAEMRRRPDGPTASLMSSTLSDGAWLALSAMLKQFRGSYAENKGVSFAVHYPVPDTETPRLQDALLALIERITEPDQRLKLVAGHAVFEIQLAGFDKGRAIKCFMADKPFHGRQPVFIGDDEMDRAAFETVLAHGGLAFSVGVPLRGLSGSFSGPDAVRAWLHELAQ